MLTKQQLGWGIGAVVVVVILLTLRSTPSLQESATSIGFGATERSIMLDKASSFASSELIDMPPEDPTAGPIGDTQDARLIQTASLTVQTDNVRESLAEVTELAGAYDGFVQSSHSSENPDGTRYGTITVRIPIAQYDAALAALRGAFVRIVEETLTTQDVTEQYTDLQARLRVARDEEQAYLALLNRSGSVSDLLQVQRELSNVRSRIERLEGQIQFLENQTDYTTITVVLQESALLSLPSKPFQPLEAAKRALQSVVTIAQDIVISLIWLLILGVGVGIPAWLIFLVGRALYRRINR